MPEFLNLLFARAFGRRINDLDPWFEILMSFNSTLFDYITENLNGVK